MRLVHLKDFRHMVFTPDSAPSLNTLRRRINTGTLSGGMLYNGDYLVDLNEFEAAHDPMAQLIRKRDELARELHAIGLAPQPPPLPDRAKELGRAYRILQRSAPHPEARPISARHVNVGRKRARALRLATPSWANRKAIRAFYEQAKEQTRLTGVRFEVDHVVPIQGRGVCGLHIETNLQVISKTENSRKRNRHESSIAAKRLIRAARRAGGLAASYVESK